VWAPEQRREKYFAPGAIETPDYPAHSEVPIPTMLPQLLLHPVDIS